MKITVGKLSIEKNGVEAKWDGMTIEGTVEETVEGYKYMLRMLPEAKEMFMTSLNEVKAYQAEERNMRRESHSMDMELENARFEHAKILANLSNVHTEEHVFKVDSAGISDDEWSEDENDESLYEIDDDEDLDPVGRAYKQTRGLKFEKDEKKPTKRSKSKK